MSVELRLGTEARSSLLPHRVARSQTARRTGQSMNRSCRGGYNRLEGTRVLERICLGSFAARPNLSEHAVRQHCREMLPLLAALAETRPERRRPAA